MKVDTLIHGIRRLYTMDPSREGLGLIEHASIATYKNNVAWIGPSNDAPEAETVIHGTGLVGLPGLIDPHTHGVWAGSRASEFSRRLAGEDYADILESGGGILSTVDATREASIESMRTCLDARLEHMRRRGVTTVETKSGYGLEVATERRMLSAMSGQVSLIGLRNIPRRLPRRVAYKLRNRLFGPGTTVFCGSKRRLARSGLQAN